MSVAVAVYSLLSARDVPAAPTPLSSITAIRAITTTSCEDPCSHRTRLDIIRSCLLTTFACTWLAIHPNIPGPYETTFIIAVRRAGIMFRTVIAPELVVASAIRQWISSRDIAKKYGSENWTQTHGFFALMGGFMLFDGDAPESVILPDQLETLSKEGAISFPKITEAEIKDRSKGDMLSKGLVVLQTSWFVLQCVTRRIKGLPVTELEVSTLGFAVVSLVMYGLWWNKPLNIRVPLRVPRLCPQQDSTQERPGDLQTVGVYNEFEGVSEDEGEKSDGNRSARQKGLTPWRQGLSAWQKGLRGMAVIWSTFWGLDEFKLREDRSGERFAMTLARPFIGLIGPGVYGGAAWKVATFSSSIKDGHGGTVAYVVGVVGAVFGSIHCIAWTSPFPSRTERLLWRIFAIVITCAPLNIATINAGHSMTSLRDALIVVSSYPYVIARLGLIVLALLSLRSLPQGAYQTVHWTTLVPHL